MLFFQGLQGSLGAQPCLVGYLCIAIPGSWARRGLRRHRSISSPMQASLRATWFLQEGIQQFGVVMLGKPYHTPSPVSKGFRTQQEEGTGILGGQQSYIHLFE